MKAKEMRSKKGEYHKNIKKYMKKSILDLNSTPPPPILWGLVHSFENYGH